MKFTRRNFIATAALGSASLALDLQGQNQPAPASGSLPKKPVIICAANGYNYLDRGYAVLTGGGDTLDAVMQVITGPEDDPNDDSVGLGGLPNEDCVVELDACCMHGPTRMAGSVAGVRDIKNVSLLAKTVMEHTGHVMLVGEGAQQFGFKMGFPKENLLTERSRKTWQLWRETCPATIGGDRGWRLLNSSFPILPETSLSITTNASSGWRSWRLGSALSRSSAWLPSNAFCIRRLARFTARQ